LLETPSVLSRGSQRTFSTRICLRGKRGSFGVTYQNFENLIYFKMILHQQKVQLSLLSHPLVTKRHFSDDRVYEIGGTRYTKADVLSIAPELRTQDQWLVLVDWSQVRTRPYVVVDPFDPAGLLYMNYSEYLVQTRTLASVIPTLQVIYRPGVVKPIPLQKYPPHPKSFHPWSEGLKSLRDFRTQSTKTNYNSYVDLKRWLTRNFKWSRDGAVLVNDRNVRGFLTLWSREVGHMLGLGSSVRREEGLNPLIEHIEHLIRHHGILQTIKIMKIMIHVILSFLAGNPLKSTHELGHRIRLSNGLPKAMGRQARAQIRAAVRTGSPQIVRYWTSVLASYKAIDATSSDNRPDLSTIAAPSGQSIPIGEFAEFCGSTEGFWARWFEAHQFNYKDGRFPLFSYKSAWGKAILAGGANSSISVSGLHADAVAWAEAPMNYPRALFSIWKDRALVNLMDLSVHEERVDQDIRDGLRGPRLEAGPSWEFMIPNRLLGEWRSLCMNLSDFMSGAAERTKNFTDLGAMLGLTYGYHKTLASKRIAQGTTSLNTQWVDKEARSKGDLLQVIRSLFFSPDSRSTPRVASRIASYLRLPHKAGYPILGRLHAIHEAAGKIRVVAICDYFTQLACEPIHSYIFSLLKGVPQDGTFDQQAAVESFAKEGHKEIYSFDLKSATDLIPIELYREVMEMLFGRKVTELWSRLLTDRWFLAPTECQGRDTPQGVMTKISKGGLVSNFIKYTRGQPMGALSSWGSMALVHHALVQFAAKPHMDTWFTAYRVLGDDIVIADPRVAESYVALCESFGITLSLAKSLISKKGVFNFASQTFSGTENVSTISLKEAISAVTWDRRIAFARRVLERFSHGVTFKEMLKRSCTFPMWNIMSSELMYGIKDGVARATQFFLHNPFSGSKPWDRPYIDSVISWLGLLNPSLDNLSTEQLSQFETVLRDSIRKMLWEKVRKDMQTALAVRKALRADYSAYLSKPHLTVFQSLYIINVLEDKVNQIIKDLQSMEDSFRMPGLSGMTTQDQLQTWVKLQSICTIPKTWDDPMSTGNKVPWAQVLAAIGAKEYEAAIKDQDDRLDLFKRTGLWSKTLPKDKLSVPYLALFEAALMSARTVLSIPRPLVNVPKGYISQLFGRYLQLRRDYLKHSFLPCLPRGKDANVIPYEFRTEAPSGAQGTLVGFLG